MPKMKDGSVVSSYFSLKKPETGQDIKDQGLRTLLGQVNKIHYTDDDTNVSKEFVEYDVVVKNDRGGQTVYHNVRFESALGGANDFEETILESNEFASKGNLDVSNLFTNQNGTLVYISFRDGSLDKPYIEGCVPHPQNVGAVRDDGIRKKGEFRGVEWEVNKDGEVILTYLSNRTPDGKLTREDTGPTSIKIDKTGAFSVVDREFQTILTDRANKILSFTQFDGTNKDKDSSPGDLINAISMDKAKKKITVTVGKDKVISEFDGDAEKVTMTFKSGLVMTFDGSNDKVDVKTKGGAEVSVDGSADKIDVKTSGGAEATIDGSADDIKLVAAGSAELHLAMGKVALGASTAELLQQISNQLQELITAFTAEATHTHPYVNVVTPSNTGPPSDAGSMATAAANLTTIKGLVDSIKGTL